MQQHLADWLQGSSQVTSSILVLLTTLSPPPDRPSQLPAVTRWAPHAPWELPSGCQRIHFSPRWRLCINLTVFLLSSAASFPANEGGEEGAASTQGPQTATLLLNLSGLLDILDLLDHQNIPNLHVSRDILDLQNIQNYLNLRQVYDLLDILDLSNSHHRPPGPPEPSRPPWPSKSPGPLRCPEPLEPLEYPQSPVFPELPGRPWLPETSEPPGPPGPFVCLGVSWLKPSSWLWIWVFSFAAALTH